jgi:hypothetical protein
MADFDIKEQRRLASLYRGMSDEELLQLSADADTLTDAAFEALEDEMDRRHLEFASPGAERQGFEARELVTIARFRDLPAALVAKTALESAGIECFLNDANLVRMDWFISNALGGMRLRVSAEDASAAWRILYRAPMDIADAEEPST